jgi:hypothetical protein
MTKDDIIRMAQGAGWEMGNDLSDGFGGRLMRFAELVYMKGYDAGVEDGCEECARVVEQAGIDGYGTLAAAAAIRARGEK